MLGRHVPEFSAVGMPLIRGYPDQRSKKSHFMKYRVIFAAAIMVGISGGASAQASSPNNNTIVLTETGVANLRIQTVPVEETDFEETVFSLGRIEEIPENHATVSSRISGKIVGLAVREGDKVVGRR